ncbi:rho guanine nucleotide exchange factor 12-like [Artemia franciscana]|uniref:rho guanine nucleotide exchange factor 12-like n=1 Tax=Artemia franciscana TaxID=6661 RepID=UPI0032DA5D48
MDPSLFSTDRFSSPHRVLEIIKDSKGFGFVVAGDKPVFIQSLREGGAAERAGLMKNDVIIKVNGVNVTDFNHAEVVNLIKAAGPFVTLTLIGQNSSSSFNGYSPSSPTSMPLSPVNLTPSIQGPDISNDRLISLPKPVDDEQQRAVDMSALRTLQTMFEREEEARNHLRAQQERHPNSRTAIELAQSEKIIKELRRKISAISGTRDWIPSSVPSSVLNVTARSPPVKRSLANFGSRKTDMGSLESEEESPPPLPVRVTSRMSNPMASPVLSPVNSERRFGSPDIVPPLPPRNNVMMQSHEDGVGPQHQRTKSSPFPYRGPKVIPDLRCMSTVDSGDLETHKAQWTTSPVPVSPAGSPPPPYSIDQPDVGGRRSNGVTFSSEAVVGTQWQIPSMEDDDWSDHESSVIEDHGPYTKISTLLEAKPYLAVFINYLLCNYDPSDLFFLLITDHYREGTSTKDMCQWAFEINTTFLVPNAPLKVQSVDEQILRGIDDVLTNFASKEERLRTVFFKARKRASGAVKMELDDFRNKRQAGLAGLFGPSDDDLKEASFDMNKEIKVIQTLLLPKLQEYSEEIDGCLDDRSLACASALATILSKVFNLKSQAAVCLLGKCPTFVTREKSLETNQLLKKMKKSVSVRGHDFALLNYMSIFECIQRGNILWGVSPQGYQCKNCKINFHEFCLRQFESGGAVEPCVGAPPLKKQAPFKWVPHIRKTTIASNGLSSESFTSPTNENDQAIGERSGSTQPSSLINGKSEQSKLKRDGSFKDSERPEVLSSSHAPLPENQDEPSQKLPKSDSRRQRSGVGRSDSLREPTRKAAISREHRKCSDPNLPPSSNHEEMTSPVVFAHSGSSSNSSLSTRSLESPGPSDSRISKSVQSDSSSSVVPWGDDSDHEADTETPDWTKMVESNILRKLSHKEKQRQEVINKLFHNERSHVRCLKVLDRVFCRPLTESNLIPDILNLLFANLNEMIEIHARFNTFMKHKRKSKGVIGNVGDILLCMFDGQEGERLQRAASQFCQHQSFALEALKERRKKEIKLDKFLYDAEKNPVCRRLQLKDVLPTGMQRLTKYPLLLESLLRHTPVKHTDHQPIKISLEKSRALLKVVNASIHEAENQHRLAELQKRLHKSSGDRSDHELRNFDLTRRRLVHEGPLTWRCKDKRPIGLHVLVLEVSIVLLQKNDNKYVLKYHTVSSTSGSEPVRCSPIIKYTSILLKPDARDSTAFYLIDQPTTSPQMCEMVSSSTSEHKAWLQHITEATESYMNREGRKRPESTVTLINLPAQTSSSCLILEQDRSNSDESNEVPVEKISADSGVGLNIVSHDSLSTSDIKPEPEQQMSADSDVVLLSPEPLKPSGEDLSSSVSRSASTVSTSRNPSRRRFQRVEILQIAEGTPLIQPTEVKVSQGDVHTAEPILTPLEKLRRKDQLIRAALVEKQRLVAEVLHVSPDELDSLVQLDSTPLK